MQKKDNRCWGKLKDHYGPAEGIDDDLVYWGSFYTEDVGECDICGEHEKPIVEDKEDPGTFYCIDCYIRNHDEQCGCSLWSDVSMS